jgi:hypothetical protein
MQTMAQVVTPVALLLCGLPLLMGRTMGRRVLRVRRVANLEF